jgi:hypothetical protein
MMCLKLVACFEWDGRWTNRLVCLDHFVNGLPPRNFYMRTRISRKANTCERKSNEHLDIAERHKITQRICDTLVLPNGMSKDMYDGSRRDDLRLCGLGMSLDAIYPVFRMGDEVFIHHERNVGLMTDFANGLKGEHLPIFLPAAQQAVKTKGQGIYIKDIERIIDDFAMIRLLIPHGRAIRKKLVARKNKAWWELYCLLMKSGIYDGTEPILSRLLHDI